MLAYDKVISTHAQNLTPRVVFVSGYRRKALESYPARATVLRACEQVQIECLTVSFDTIPVGKYKKQPPFHEMVQESIRILSENPAPTLLLGHCGGGAVALETSKRIDRDLLLGLVLLCPLVAPSKHVPLLKRLGISWLRKEVLSSQDYRAANANKREYLAASQEILEHITPISLSHIPDKKTVLVGAAFDKTCSTQATKILARSLEVPYFEVKDRHSPKRPETSQKLADVIKSIL